MYKLPFIIFLLGIKIILAQSPHGANFNYECQACHTTDNWKITGKVNFAHEQTGFELVGQHKVLDCASCHKTLNFTGTSSDCFQCHTDIHNNTVSKNCDNCHTSNSWIIQNTNEIHSMSRFPLLGVHQQVDCNVCHKSFNNLQFEQQGIECKDCHRQDYEATLSPNHRQADFSTDCDECHLVSDTQWSKGKFEHSFFPLVGGHRISNCFNCHSSNSFKGLTQDCFACHKQDYNSTSNPNHIELDFSKNCLECHTTNPNWQPAEFQEHNNFYPLLGGHKNVNCSKCHTNGYKNTPTDCYSCHQNDYTASVNPNHKSAGFSTDCESCHNLNSWKPASFDHDNQFFPIYSGKHNNKWNNCSDCHTNQNDYSQFSCLICHEHRKSKMDDEHKKINGYSYISTACLSCHPTGSEKDRFSHSATQFPLTGAHVSVECSTCHTNGYSGTPTNCSTCHKSNYTTATNPNHSDAGLALTCEECHTTTSWKPSTFSHSSTGFELAGGHNLPQCSSCHSGSTSNATPDCYSCHISNYTSAPEHVSRNYPKECQQCHNTTDWKQATFNHSETQFPLTGAHVNVDCNTCHTNGYSGTPTNCSACHKSNYTTATNPNHSDAGVALTCEECHTTTSWKPSTFSHSSTGFELAGGHNLPQCSSCHSGSTSNATPDCYSCHTSNYISAPEHVSRNYPKECQQCHNTTDWKQSTFDHSSTEFPLTGAHINVDCSTCHTNGYSGTPTNCSACHKSNYTTATNPNHSDAGLALTCEECHTTTSWKPSTFNHSSTGFELAGGHNLPQCSSCHLGSTSNTSSDCYSCHQNDYNNTSNPSHQNSGFGTQCLDCHTTKAWTPATFDHDGQYFPIYSGKHRGEWNSCSDCHTNQNDYSQFSCLTCHEHSQTKMNDKHKDVNGYSYNSSACLSCHPNGKE